MTGRLIKYWFLWASYGSRERAFEKASFQNDEEDHFQTMAMTYINIMIALSLCFIFTPFLPLIMPCGVLFLLSVVPLMKFFIFARLPEDYTDSGGMLWRQCTRHFMWIMAIFYVFVIGAALLRASYRRQDEGKDDASSGIVLGVVLVATFTFFPVAAYMLNVKHFDQLPLREARKLEYAFTFFGHLLIQQVQNFFVLKFVFHSITSFEC
jgi:hypothetical protein